MTADIRELLESIAADMGITCPNTMTDTKLVNSICDYK